MIPRVEQPADWVDGRDTSTQFIYINKIEPKRLTAAQARRLGDRVGPMLSFLIRFKERLDEVGFPPDGELPRVVTKALDAVHHLSVVLHHESCSHGVGRKPKPE